MGRTGLPKGWIDSFDDFVFHDPPALIETISMGQTVIDGFRRALNLVQPSEFNSSIDPDDLPLGTTIVIEVFAKCIDGGMDCLQQFSDDEDVMLGFRLLYQGK